MKLENIATEAFKKWKIDIAVEVWEKWEVLWFNYDVDAYTDSTNAYIIRTLDPEKLFTLGRNEDIYQKDITVVMETLQKDIIMCLSTNSMNDNFIPHWNILINESHIEIIVLLKDASISEYSWESHTQKWNNIWVQNLYNTHNENEIVGYRIYINNSNELYYMIQKWGYSIFDIDDISKIKNIVGSSETEIEKVLTSQIKKAA